MDLYLIRHADAVPLGEGGITTDEERPLTDKGKDQAKALSLALQKHGIKLAKVFTSPLLRARQTAEEMVSSWQGPAPTLELCVHLAPGGKRKRLAKLLRALPNDSFALVGHQPDIAAFAAWLIGSKKAQLDIAKAGVACISCGIAPKKDSGTLLWLVTPEWLT